MFTVKTLFNHAGMATKKILWVNLSDFASTLATVDTIGTILTVL